jgi:hypothetical protein
MERAPKERFAYENGKKHLIFLGGLGKRCNRGKGYFLQFRRTLRIHELEEEFKS